MVQEPTDRAAELEKLAWLEGYESVEAFLAKACGTSTVQSALVLAERI